MNDAASLQNLHDIVVQPTVPWWPPAPGWYFVLATLLAVSIWFFARAAKRYQSNRYRREALKELAQLQHAARDFESRARALSALPDLLKRSTLAAFSRDRVASLSGGAWHRFLDDTAGIEDFCAWAGVQLDSLAYDPISLEAFDDEALTKLFAVVGRWLKTHRAE